MKSLLKFFVDGRIWSYGLFGAWNLIFVAFMVLGFGPQLLPDLALSVAAGMIPILFLVLAVVLTLIPLIAITIALIWLRRSPEGLFALGYGIEWPLMFMLALRFFFLRDATFPVGFVMTMASLGMVTLLWQILDKRIDERGTPLTIVRVLGLTVLAFAYLYGSLWVAFYAVPVGGFLWQALDTFVRNIGEMIARFDWRNLIALGWMVPMTILWSTLMMFSATLFALGPIAVPVIAIRAWWRSVNTLGQRAGLYRVLAFASVVLIACIATTVLTNTQPQRTTFTLLEKPPTTREGAQLLTRQEDTLRAGLLNMYLAQFRYLSAIGETRHVRDMYKQAYHLTDADTAPIGQFYDIVASPLLYEPVKPSAVKNVSDGLSLREEPEQAAKLYKAYFDARILDGEHTIIADTVRLTWSSSQAELALQAVDDQKILVTRQDLNVTEHGDWADIELHEVYQNQTNQNQEVVYYFSLPESAVVTGLWLGESEDRSKRFSYRVAPRGAAQATYRNEVRRNVDPALVEQIGPRQYRLRVFPVAPRRIQSRNITGSGGIMIEGTPMHMWLTYRVLASDSAWALPQLAEKRNVYWDATTARTVNGKAMPPNAQTWLAGSIAATAPTTPTAHRIELSSGEIVIARPTAARDLPALRDNLQLAIVLDRSRSMSKYAADVKSTLARLSRFGNADVYLAASVYRGEPASRVKLNALDLDRIEYIGGQNAGELLAQFGNLYAREKYDAIFVITDGSGYELGDSGFKPPVPDAPVWMIHLGGKLPLGYDDATLEAIQASGGGVAGNLDDALNRLAVSLNRGMIASNDVPTGATADWVDGYAWFVTARNKPGNAAPLIANDDGFGAIAARRIILDAMYRERANLRNLSTLDQLHAIAVNQSIVTQYSSMLVLVNPQQQQLLKQLEQQGDRFDREVENVGDTLGQIAPDVTGVPEPHEWLLIALAAAMLGGYAYKKRNASRMIRVSGG